MNEFKTIASMELNLVDGTSRDLHISVPHPVERKRTEREVVRYVIGLEFVVINEEYVKQSSIVSVENVKVW